MLPPAAATVPSRFRLEEITARLSVLILPAVWLASCKAFTVRILPEASVMSPVKLMCFACRVVFCPSEEPATLIVSCVVAPPFGSTLPML